MLDLDDPALGVQSDLPPDSHNDCFNSYTVSIWLFPFVDSDDKEILWIDNNGTGNN